MFTGKQRATHTIIRLATLMLKLGIAVLLIGWLFSQRRITLSLSLLLHPTAQTIALVCAAAGAVCLGLLCMAWRFEQLLRCVGFPLSYREALGLTFIGSFTGAVLPGLLGGDVVRAIYLCRHSTHQRSKAIAAIMVDRVLGLYALMSLAVLALPLVSCWHLTQMDRHIQLVLLILWGGVTSGGLILTSCRWIHMPAYQRLHSSLPQLLRHLTEALVAYCATPRLLIASLLLSMLNHLLVIISFWIVGVIIGDSLSLVGHLVINPLAMLLNAIPLAPGGVGITESGFSLLFEHAGSPNGATIGLFGRVIQYVVFTLGGIPALLLLKIRRISAETAETIPRVAEGATV